MNRKWWVLFAVGTGSFLATFSGSIVNTVLPILGEVYKSPIGTIQWVLTIYLLVISSLLLSFGRLGDLYGHRNIYAFGLLVYSIGTGLCAFAPNVASLIGFRAIQAFGAAMIFANSPAILTRAFGAEERGKAMGLQATLTYLGLMLGPPVGGFLAAHAWRGVFLVPLPFSVLALAASILWIPADTREEKAEAFDFMGSALFGVSLVALLLGMNQGKSLGTPAMAGIYGTAIAAFALFLRVETRRSSPMLDLSLFKSRILSGSTLSALLNYACTYALLFLMPFYLIQGRGMDPAHMGMLLMIQPLVMILVAPLSGTLSDRIAPRILATLGMGCLGVGMGLLSLLSAQSAMGMVALALATSGLGSGLFTAPNNNALMGAAPRGRQGVAGGILATARNVGMTLGVGLAGAIFSAFHSISLYVAVDRTFAAMVFVALAGALVSFLAKEQPIPQDLF